MNNELNDNNDIEESLQLLFGDDGQFVNEAMESLISEAYEGIIILDKNGYCRYTNKKHARYLKIPQRKARNLHITEMTDKKTADIFLEILRNGVPDLRGIVQAHGKEYVANRVPIKKGDKIIGVAGIILFDIKEADRLNKRMIRLENRLKFFMNQVKSLQSSKYSFEDIIGESEIINKTIKEAKQAASVDANVLLAGESGTGKELFAHAIHNQSRRKSEPLIKVNCSAVPRELLESELFGYAPGAFTGALKEGKKGKFELADKGTIFLDEIGDMPLQMQSTLLRVLQEKEVDRIGGIKPVKVDFRLIAATNWNLKESVEKGTFRKDLYYRLNVVSIEAPPLRERRRDIPLLVNSFLQGKSNELGGIEITSSSEALKMIQLYDFPGNVRELQNILERALSKMDIDILSAKKLIITEEHVASALNPDSITGEKVALPVQVEDKGISEVNGLDNLKQTMRDHEIQAIKKAIELSGGNLTEAAKTLGIHRTIIHRKIKSFNLDSDVLLARKKSIEKMIENKLP